MALKTASFFLTLLISSTVLGSDTLYFRLSNPWNTVKSPTGKYLRKCIKENDYYHVWDYNSNNIMVTESFYSDTNFTKNFFATNILMRQMVFYNNLVVTKMDDYMDILLAMTLRVTQLHIKFMKTVLLLKNGILTKMIKV